MPYLKKTYPTEQFKIEFLGKGLAGGSAFRVFNSSRDLVLKKYKEQKSLDNDIDGFDFLRQVVRANPELELNIPNTTRLSPVLLQLEYIPGEIAEMFVGLRYRYDIKEETRDEIEDRVEFMYAILQQVLTTEYHALEINADRGHYSSRTGANQQFNIYLHTENILVDNRDGSLWVIDPY